MTAVSVKDTFAIETAEISATDITNWDGSEIIVFGGISYEDTFGSPYCTPYLTARLSGGGRVDLSELTGPSVPISHNVAELCPVGKH